MAPRYRKVTVAVWTDARFRALSPLPPCGQGLWLYLLTARESIKIPGLIPAGRGALAESLRWSPEAFREAFAEASREGMVEADWSAPLVFLPKAIEHNAPESPNVVRGWRDQWSEIPDCGLKLNAWSTLKAFLEGLGEPFAKAFREACQKPSPHPSANQEQEQEQEQDLEALSLACAREVEEREPTAAPTGSRTPPTPMQGTEGAAGGACTDPGPARVQPPSVPASTPDDLTPRERGALHRLGLTPPDERYPETAALLRELRARGWAEAGWPKPEGRGGVEGLVRKVTVPVAAERLMALSPEERSSRWTLGWHVDAIAGKQRRNRAGDLGVVYGGRWWESMTPDELERFRSERSALDPELDAAAPMPAVGALCPDAVQALIDRWRTRDARRHAGEDPRADGADPGTVPPGEAVAGAASGR